MANANYQVSSKMNDGRIFVVAADDFNSFTANLKSILGDVDAEALLTTMAGSLTGGPVSMEMAASTITSILGGQAQPTPSTYAPPSNSGPATAPMGRSCKHGPMTKRSGAGAKGPWKAYMCPSPKGTPDQCEPIFIRRNEPEWNTFN